MGISLNGATKGAHRLQERSDWFSQFANGTHQFCRTERAAHDQTGHSYGARTVWPEAVRVSQNRRVPLPDSVADQAGQFWQMNRLTFGVNKTKNVLLIWFYLLFFFPVLFRSPISLSSPRALRKVALALYFASLHLLAFMYIFQVVF